MSEENKNLGDEAKDAFEEVKEEAKETAQEFKEGAKKAMDDLGEMGGENKKLLAGILAILIGSLGIHKFILGYTKEGIIQIVITFVTCGIGGIIPFIEGIIYLTKSDDEFYQTYQVNQRPWF